MDFKALRTALSDVKTVYIEQDTDYLFLGNGFFLLRLPRHAALTQKVLKETKRYFPEVPSAGEGVYRFTNGTRTNYPNMLSNVWRDRVTSYIGELTDVYPTEVVLGRDYYQRLYTSKTDPVITCWLADMQTDIAKDDARHYWTTRGGAEGNQPVLMECHSKYRDYQMLVMHCDVRRDEVAAAASTLYAVLNKELANA